RRRERVVEALDGDTRAGITVRVPSSADARCSFERERLEAHAADFVERIKAGESGADDQDVDLLPPFAHRPPPQMQGFYRPLAPGERQGSAGREVRPSSPLFRDGSSPPSVGESVQTQKAQGFARAGGPSGGRLLR